MKTESRIREILRGLKNTDGKIKDITSFINWDEKKLRNSIEKHGTSTNEARTKIIEDFWGKK